MVEEATILDSRDLKDVMTKKRREIISYLSTNEVDSISSLSKELGRKRSRVTMDLRILEDKGIVEFEEDTNGKSPNLRNGSIVTRPIDVSKLAVVSDNLDIPINEKEFSERKENSEKEIVDPSEIKLSGVSSERVRMRNVKDFLEGYFNHRGFEIGKEKAVLEKAINHTYESSGEELPNLKDLIETLENISTNPEEYVSDDVEKTVIDSYKEYSQDILGKLSDFRSTDKYNNSNGVKIGLDNQNNEIFLNRRRLVEEGYLENCNSISVGRIGSGKTYGSKLEILRSLKEFNNYNVIVIDFLDGYNDLTSYFDTEPIQIGENSSINILNSHKQGRLQEILVECGITPDMNLSDDEMEDIFSKLYSEFSDEDDGYNSEIDSWDKRKEVAYESAKESLDDDLLFGEENFEIGGEKFQYFDFSGLERNKNKLELSIKCLIGRILNETYSDNENYLLVVDNAHIIFESGTTFIESALRDSKESNLGINLLTQYVRDSLDTDNIPLRFYYQLDNQNMTLLDGLSEDELNFIQKASSTNGYSEFLFSVKDDGSLKIRSQPEEDEDNIIF